MYDCVMRLKILIVEYDQFEADLLDKIIIAHGHNSTTCINPEEAIDLVSDHYKKNNPFDVIFTEFILDKTTGIELSKKLKTIDPALTIVFITADNSTETKSKIARNADFSGFINKAADLSQIKHHLNVAMANKKEKMSRDKSVYLKQAKEPPK